MATVSIQEQLRQVLTFLFGLKDTRIRNYLSAFGFTGEELQKGWNLLLKIAGGKLDEQSFTDYTVTQALKDLDQWENKWFPVTHAALRNNYPEAGEMVFLNLTQQSGREVIISTSTFLERITRLTTDKSIPMAKEAAALLERRGLTPDERQKAYDLLSTIKELEIPADSGKTTTDDEDVSEEDVTALIRWYDEWSDIARIAIPRKDLRIRLGISARSAGGKNEEQSSSDESGN